MGTSVTQCLDCGTWNWDNKEKCVDCSGKLSTTFHQVYDYYKSKVPEFFNNKKRDK